MKLPWNFSRPGSAWVMDRSGIYVERGVDEPRYQWTPDGRSEGLLVERQATNRAVFSEFSASTPAGGMVQVATGWGRGLPATGLRPPESGTVYAYRQVPVALGESGVLSFFVKFDDGGPPIFGSESGSAESVSFAMNTPGTGTNGMTSAEIEDRGDGVYRVSKPWTSGSDTTHSFGIVRYNQQRFRLFTVSGYQIEGGSKATTYVPTGDTAVTRPADTLYADMSLVDGFDPTKGTIVVEWVQSDLTSDSFALAASATVGSSTPRIISSRTQSVRYRVAVVSNNVTEYTSDGPDATLAVGKVARVAIRYASDGSCAFSFDGSNVYSLSQHSEGLPEGLRYLHIGRGQPGLYRHVQYIPQAVSDAQLQQLSSLS